MKTLLILLVLTLSLCACSTKKTVQNETASADFVALTLSKAAENAHTDLAMLAKLRGQGIDILLPPLDPSLEKPISLSWTGEAGGALKEICLALGYKYKEMGTASGQSLSVVVYGLNTPAHEILEDISWQVEPQAKVKIDPFERSITLARTQKAVR